jgi:hypothetical protein
MAIELPIFSSGPLSDLSSFSVAAALSLEISRSSSPKAVLVT